MRVLGLLPSPWRVARRNQGLVSKRPLLCPAAAHGSRSAPVVRSAPPAKAWPMSAAPQAIERASGWIGYQWAVRVMILLTPEPWGLSVPRPTKGSALGWSR